MKQKCKHIRLTKIAHWWFRFECDCGKRFRWIPKGDYYTCYN